MRFVVIFLLLAACSEVDESDIIRVQWKRFANANDLARNCDSRMQGATMGEPFYASGKVLGCYDRLGDMCYIRTMQDTDLDTLGHELKHCFEGRWHE